MLSARAGDTRSGSALDDATERGPRVLRRSSTCCWRCWRDEKTAEVVKHCGGSVKRLQDKLEAFLDKEIKPLPEDERERAQPTLGFARVVQRAVNHVLGAGKERGHRRRTCWWRCSPSPIRTRWPS